MMPVLVCETVTADTTVGLIRARDAVIGADLVELRLDGVADPDPAAALAGRRVPAVVTCRPRWEGGRFDGDEETRRALLERAGEAGAEFMDVEWRAPWRDAFLARWASRTVLSFHDFTGVPDDLAARVHAMRRSRPAVTKVAVATNRLRDLEALLAIGRGATEREPLVVIGMGPAGFATRVLASRFGSCWTYAGQGVAPGQVPTSQLLEVFRARALGPSTLVLGLLGRPVTHSVSPAMHNAGFAALGIDAVYLPFEAADFDDFQWLADALHVVGASVTAPFKAAAFEAAVRADVQATALGVANTLRREPDGSWAARNTDVEGFLAPLADVSLDGVRAAVLGAGGAARAVTAALVQRGAIVTVHARRPDAAGAIASTLDVAVGAWPPSNDAWDLLVNTTPVGTWPDVEASPVEAPFVQGHIVYDVVYNPPQTALLRAAAAHGCRTIGGLDMLVAQAGRQFEWWTGQAPPLAVMRAAAERQLAKFRSEVTPRPQP